ncbi:hypothetical protein BAE40_13165 [Mesorhizobium loti]|nr:hypothetical protein BAE40_13165 [Mesorhizobium loti]
MDIEIARHVGVDLLEEVRKLGCPVPLVAFANHNAGRHIERREQRGGAVSDRAMGPALRHARHHRQDRLLPIECLDLALFSSTLKTRALLSGDR